MQLRIVRLAEVDSTNSQAWRELEAGGSDGVVVIAGRQTWGRGRLGRQWSSPEGNLHISVLRRIREGLDRAGGISLLAGIAAADAVERVAGVAADLKWPNDLWVKGKKLGGILLEGRPGWHRGPKNEVDTGNAGDRPGAECCRRGDRTEHWQVVGVGVNVNVPVAALSPEVHDSATTLLELTGKKWPLEDLAEAFLARFAELEKRFLEEERLPLDAYMARFPFVGQRAAVYHRDRQLEGTIAGVAEDGALLLACEGETVRIVSGEVIHVRPR